MSAITTGESCARRIQTRSEFCRCTLFLVVGGWLVLAGLLGLDQANIRPQPPTAWIILGILLGLLPLLLAAHAHTFQLLLDERGLSRRRFGWWTHWPWEDVIAGKITRQRGSGILANAARPWWDRWLMLDFVPTADVVFVVEA